MTDIPATGGRFARDPKTGELTPLPEDAQASHDPAPETPEPPAAPQTAKSKGKA